MKRVSNRTMTLLVILYAISNIGFALDDARLLRSPDVNGDKIVFVYAGDIWTASINGGTATRLTTHPGYEAQPLFSPDGRWIAFNGQYDGNTDVYIIPASGGEPVRLTYHPGVDSVVAWSRDGKFVVFSSGRESLTRMSQFFKIAVDGVFPEKLPLPMAFHGSFSPDGESMAYNPLSANVFRGWRRYRGGTAPYIWIYNFQSQSVKKIERQAGNESNDVFPRWIGENVYFLSDRDRVMNLYRYNVKTENLDQITSFSGADIKTFGMDDRNIVFEREGYLHILDNNGGEATKLSINIPNEWINRRPRFVNAGRLIFDSAISPTGKRAVFNARGEIVTVPSEKGDIRNLTQTPCRMERRPAWSPDGKWIAYFGEHNQEYSIKIMDQLGKEPARIIEVEDPTYFYDLVWSPDSKKLAFNDVKQNLYILDVESAEFTLVDTDTDFLHYPRPSWSPDSEWLAYPLSASNGFSAIHLYSLAQKKSFQITDAMSEASDPVFHKNGKYLSFTASTDLAQDVAWLDMSEYPNNPTNNLYLVVLDKETPSPFLPESDEEKVKEESKPAGDDEAKTEVEPEKDEKAEKKDNDDKKADKKISVDLDGIQHRIISYGLPTGRFSSLQTAKNTLYYLSMSLENRSSDLHMYDISKKKDEVLISGINRYELSADGKKMLYSIRNQWAIVDAGKKIKPGDGALKTSAIETWVVPELEYRQMLYEAWRINRDFFYDPGMHGQDWDQIWKQYEQYLPYVAHRTDLSYLIDMMIGEYTCGHARNMGGMYPDVDSVPGGLLGADFQIYDGRYRIEKIYTGENWNPTLRSPLAGPGIDIREGDLILKVNNREVTSGENIYMFFQKTAGKQVDLLVSDKAVDGNERTVTVVPVGSESTLRHRQWIEDNRLKVSKLTDGKVGYVYLPNTGAGGFTYFNRYFFAQLDKDAIVFDERFNGGGYVADYIVNTLQRPFLSWWQPRYGKPFASPNSGHFGPKVMIINEFAGSGGDFMPWAFRETGVGKLVGKRTWGGLVGISGYPALMDGGYVTAPSFGIVSKDGEFIIENVGVAPDYEVDYFPADYIAGKDPQLLKAIEVVLEEMKTKKAPKFKHNGFPRGR